MLKLCRSRFLTLGSGLACLPLMAAAQAEASYELYGSLRTQYEWVSPDRETSFTDYNAFRDAYSRVGIKGVYPLHPDLSLLGQLEIPFDSANLEFRDPYDQGGSGRADGQSLRLAYAGVQGTLGSLTFGQQWMPYYNAIAAPVDMFSSYYSGYATYTVFRVADTLAYVSPNYKGLSLAAAYSGANGNQRSTSRIDARRAQLTTSYTVGDTQFSAGIDDRGNAGYGRNRVYGLAASQHLGDWYLAAKYERFDSGNQTAGSFSTDGNQAINLFTSYTWGKFTAKLMLARVENYGDNIVHTGVDYQFASRLKFFAEYYREAQTAAISRKRGGLSDFDASISGGNAFLFGARYDF